MKTKSRFVSTTPCHTSATKCTPRPTRRTAHEKAPKSLQAQWQRDDLCDLSKKLEDLRSEAAEDDSESERLGSFEFEQNRRRAAGRAKSAALAIMRSCSSCWLRAWVQVGLGTFRMRRCNSRALQRQGIFLFTVHYRFGPE